jgi:predicted ATP-dependent protease
MPVDDAESMIREVRPWYKRWIGTRSIYPERHMRFINAASTLSEFETRMTLAPRAQEELAAFLDVRLRIAERARALTSSAAGRLFNILSRENPDYVRLTGSELKDVLQIIGAEVDDIVDPRAVFDLRVDVIGEALATLQTYASSTPVQS